MMKWILALLLVTGFAYASETTATAWPFEPLPYAYDALEPHIDAETMEVHYDRHHRAYFNNLVSAAEDHPALKQLPIETIMGQISAWPVFVRNNAGGHYNHTLFWEIMSPDGGGEPDGMLAMAINEAFGSFEAFRKEFNQAAATVFGSGWAWLSVAADGTLFVSATPNQDNPLMDVVEKRGTPILGLDVWEHAYYLKFQNRRGSYIEAFWEVINWPAVSARFRDAIK